ncbi:hypothetical protein O1L55_16315 [Streptomyces albulus]|nr:hypothetical protein [Streptomyces noursei]
MLLNDPQRCQHAPVPMEQPVAEPALRPAQPRQHLLQLHDPQIAVDVDQRVEDEEVLAGHGDDTAVRCRHLDQFLGPQELGGGPCATLDLVDGPRIWLKHRHFPWFATEVVQPHRPQLGRVGAPLVHLAGPQEVQARGGARSQNSQEAPADFTDDAVLPVR